MKNKKKMALALISVLSLSVLTLSVFADTPVISSNSDTSVQETQKDQQHKEKSNNSSTDEKSTDSEMGGKTDGCRGQGMHHGRHDEEKVAEPENAIGSDAAEAKALEDAGVTEDQAGRVMSHVSQLDDGTVVYRVHFIYNDQMYFYQINATNGEIVDKRNEAVTEDKMAEHRGRGRHDEEQVAEPENAIGKDAAKAKALEDAGVTEDQAGKIKSHVSKLDDGTVVYRVHFIYNDQMYSYQINATSGEIVDKSNEAATEDKMTGHRGHSKEKVDTATDSSTQDATTAA